MKRRTFAVRAALVATLLGIALAIAWLLIAHCSINMPTFLTGGRQLTIVSLCDDRGPLADGEALRGYLESMEREFLRLKDACGSGTAAAPEPPPVADPAPVHYTVRHKSPPPTFGRFCGMQVCNPSLEWHRPEDDHVSCGRIDAARVELPDDPPADNTCYVVQVPTLLLADPGTAFTGSAELLVNGEVVKTWQYESEAVSQASVERGLREGSPVTYQVGRFPSPFRPE